MEAWHSRTALGKLSWFRPLECWVHPRDQLENRRGQWTNTSSEKAYHATLRISKRVSCFSPKSYRNHEGFQAGEWKSGGCFRKAISQSVWRTDGIYLRRELHTQQSSLPPPGALPSGFPYFASIPSNQGFRRPLMFPYFLSQTLAYPVLCSQDFSS